MIKKLTEISMDININNHISVITIHDYRMIISESLDFRYLTISPNILQLDYIFRSFSTTHD